MTEPPTSTKPRGLAARIGDPLAWSDADKCLVIVLIMLPGVGIIELFRLFFGGWFYVSPEVNPSLHGLEDQLAIVAAAVWALLGVWGLIIRQRAPNSRLYSWVTIQCYAVTVAMFMWIIGPFHSPGWILVLAGVVIGFLLFGSMALVSVVTFLALGILLVVGSELGWFGSLPYANHAPPVGSPEWRPWLGRMGAASLFFASFTVVLFAYVISLLRDREARLERMSKTDGLTGVNNRRHLMELLDVEIVRSRRYKTSVSCIMVDLDHFKSINDRHGHLIGDQVLVAVADVLVQSVRDSDVVARYGGEEFVLLLPETDLEGARELAERCRGLVATTHLDTSDGTVTVTASMGIATASGESLEGVDDLLGAADQALYEAKHAGRNRVAVAAAVASAG